MDTDRWLKIAILKELRSVSNIQNIKWHHIEDMSVENDLNEDHSGLKHFYLPDNLTHIWVKLPRVRK